MFVVRWTRSALDDLAYVWLHAGHADRAAITRAAHAVEHLLKRDPETVGESRAKGRRILFLAPLVVLYRVEDQTVRVLEVYRYGSASGTN